MVLSSCFRFIDPEKDKVRMLPQERRGGRLQTGRKRREKKAKSFCLVLSAPVPSAPRRNEFREWRKATHMSWSPEWGRC